MRFRDRIHAGQLLAALLSEYMAAPDVLVCALPRGGVVVGFELAQILRSPLEILVVRKLGVPGQKELAMGAIASGGIRVLRHDLIEELEISDRVLEKIVAEEERELERREAAYRGGAPAPQISGRTIILVDDGLATGATMWAAAMSVRQQQPKRLVIAVPVAPPSACNELSAQADEIVCILQPELFDAISEFYQDFHEVSDEEVKDLLRSAASRTSRKLA